MSEVERHVSLILDNTGDFVVPVCRVPLWFHGESYMKGLRDAKASMPDGWPGKNARYLEGPFFLWIMRFVFGLILIYFGYMTFAELQLLFQ